MIHGIKRAKKFKIGSDGCPAYEALINSTLVRITKEDHFTNFGDYFVVVHYTDMGFVDERSEEEKEKEDGDNEPSNSRRNGGHGSDSKA